MTALSPRALRCTLAAAGIAVLFAAELALHHLASAHVAAYPAYMRALPTHEVGEDHRFPAAISLGLVVLAFAQTALLYAICRLRPERSLALPFAVAAFLMAAIAVLAGTTTTEDPWAYLGYAKFDTFAQAYAPPDRLFAPPYDVINAIWHRPMTACDYGPLWLAFDRALLRPTRDLWSALVAMRVAGVAEVGVLYVLLGSLGVAQRTRLLVLVNPAIALEYIVNAHNDLLGVVLVVAGMAASRRSIVAGAVVASCAVLVKVTFLFVAIGALAVGMTRAGRVSTAAGIVVLAAAGSVLGGTAYLHALLRELGIGAHRGGDAGAGSLLLQGAVALCALAALALSVVADRRVGAASWSFGALSTRFYASYSLWGLPYALACGEYAATFLIALPIADVMLDFGFPGSGTAARVLILVYVVAAGAFAAGLRPALRSRPIA